MFPVTCHFPVELSCDAALMLATWVDPGLVVAVSVEGCPLSVIGLKSEVDAISWTLTDRGRHSPLEPCQHRESVSKLACLAGTVV